MLGRQDETQLIAQHAEEFFGAVAAP